MLGERIMHPFRHFAVITRHRHLVIKHCFKAGIPLQGLLHDLSKYSPAEFIPSAKCFAGDRSPNEVEREKYGYSKAWLHHKGRNRHHHQYWNDIDPVTRRSRPVKMPLRYVVEMFCDWVAASKVYNGNKYTDGTPLSYFLRGKPNRIIDPETSDFFENLMRMLAEKGEEETFAYIRSYMKSRKDY